MFADIYQVEIEVVQLQVLERLEHRATDLAGRMVVVPGMVKAKAAHHKSRDDIVG